MKNRQKQLTVAIINTEAIEWRKRKIDELSNEIHELRDSINKTLQSLDDDSGTVIRFNNETYLCKRTGITKVNDLGAVNHDSNTTGNR